jgi:NAD(P)-dependent dehydrogenase (short-subunit alcohol dehydrogenase family)
VKEIQMSAPIDNKRFLVVGASRGLGRGIAEALAAAGAHVLAISRDAGALKELRDANQGRIDIRAGDATHPSFVARVMAEEDPDGLFITLGAQPVMRPLHEYGWESFCDVWNVDVKATFHWLQDAVNKPMRDGGRIVVLSSGAARFGSPLSGGYAGAKQTQRFLCQYMSGELERLGRDLRIQCVLPQLNPNTELGRASVRGYAERAGEEPAAFVQKRFGDTPLSPQIAGAEMVKLLTDDELAGTAEFMLPGAGLKPLPK